MLNMLKTKKCLAVSVLFLLLSFPAKATKLTALGLGNKYDYFDTSMEEKNMEDTPLGKALKELHKAGMNDQGNYFYQEPNLVALAAIDLDKDPKELYENSYELQEYFRYQTKYANLEVAEFKRDKNRLPEPFVELVKMAKEYVKQYYTLDEFSLYNYSYFDHSVEYDAEKGILIFPQPEIRDFVYGEGDVFIYYDDNGKTGGGDSIVIDVPLEEMKKLSLDGEFDYALNFSFEKVKESFMGLFEKSPEKLMLEHKKPKWKFKALSSKVRVAKAKYHNGYSKNEGSFQERELGTLEVKNPRLCSYFDLKDCIKLEVSDSF